MIPLYFLAGYFLSLLTSYIIAADMQSENKVFYGIVVFIIVALFVILSIL